jgi:hypothetical protein
LRKIHTIKIFTFILLFTTVNNAISYGSSGKNDDSPDGNCEKIFVHLNKLVYAAGESLFYKVYVVDGKLPLQKPASNILYLSLAECGNGKCVPWRINLNSSTVFGSYQLPEDLNPGVYELKAYTNRIKENAPETIFSQDLIILNLAKETPKTLSISEQQVLDGSSYGSMLISDQEPSIQVNTSKSLYGPDEHVMLEISSKNLALSDTAKLSISVSSETENPLITHIDPVNQFSLYKGQTAQTCTSGLENHGYILSGRIKDKESNSPVSGAGILLAVTDSIAPQMLFAETDITGNFRFYVSSFFDNKMLILQCMKDPEDLEIVWEIDNKNINGCTRNHTSIPLTTEQTAFLDQTKDIRLINAIYENTSEEEHSSAIIKRPNFFGVPDMIIYPDDFAEMVNFKEIADNLLPTVRFTIRNKNYSIQVYNSVAKDWLRNSTVLLNGIPFSDLNYIATLGSFDIQRVEVVSSRFFAGNLTFQGIVSIYTRDHQIPATYIDSHTLVFPNDVAETSMNNQKTDLSANIQSGAHLPDFRFNLYWNPDLQISGNNQAFVEFTTSQLSGKYQVNIQGITTSGDPLSATLSFEVK